MKIFDQIKKLTIEDMALFLCQMEKSCIDCDYDGNKSECLINLANYIEWLESEDDLFDVDSNTIFEQVDESGFNGLTLKINFEPDMDALRNILIDGLKLSR